MAILLSGLECSSLAEWNTASGGSVVGSPVRTGNYALRLGNAEHVEYDGTSGQAEYGRIYFRKNANPSTEINILHLRAGISDEDCADIFIDSSGELQGQAIGGTKQSGPTLDDDEWYRIEWRYAVPGNRLDWWVAGVKQTTSTGTAAFTVDVLHLFGNDSTNYFYYDDCRTDENALPGVGQIEALRPEGDSDTAGFDEFEDESANAETFSAVNHDPVEEAEYAIETDQGDSNHNQLWKLPTIADVGTINHIRLGVWAERGSGSGTNHYMRGDNGGNVSTQEIALSTSYEYHTVDPIDFSEPSTPNTQGELDAYEAGVRRNAGGREYYVAEYWVMVDYTPGAAGGPAGLKTVDGLAVASIKTVDGLAIASVKTYNGLA